MRNASIASWVARFFMIGGMVGNGVASVISAAIGGMGVNTYGISVGLSATGIAGRALGYIIAIAFAVLSLIPASAALITTIPPPVVGAALFFTAAFVFTSGLQLPRACWTPPYSLHNGFSRLQWPRSLAPATCWRSRPASS